ncbi:hypothetical protein [Aquipuribacter sp. SD81]|uniref:hypothetical protein n=1 Tax=Aquipuribacter sp. SD81 TaxID=3127703 RepID=UPI0030185706
MLARLGGVLGDVLGDVLAHGVGSRQDLPLPFLHVVVGAAAAIAVSFVVLGLAWRTPQLLVQGAGTPLPRPVARVLDSPALRWVLRAAVLAVTLLFALALVLGPDDVDNPAPGMFYVWLWAGLVPASLLLGPVWRVVSPLRTVHAGLATVLRVDREHGLLELPARLGWWPGAAGLAAFVWLELAAPGRATQPVLQAWVGAYVAVHLVAGVLFGARWYTRGEGFEAVSDVVGRLSPLGRREDGVLVLRTPLDGAASLRPAPGLVALLCLLLGSTMFDSLTSATRYVRVAQSSGLPRVVVDTVVLAGVVGLVVLAYVVATRAAAGGDRGLRDVLPGELAHSLVPIAVGYLVAHYYSLLVLEGQRTLALASDPLGTGADWFGTADLSVSAALTDPAGVALLQVVAIVFGHVLGTVLAHDRALALLPRGRAVAGQVPLLLLMVAYTVAGLVLLFAG